MSASETINWLKKYLDPVHEAYDQLYYAIKNIDYYDIPDEHKPRASMFLRWLRMKLSHLIDEAEMKLQELEEQLEERA